MKLSSLIGHSAEILHVLISAPASAAEESPSAADRYIDRYFRGRRYLGSRDRRFISDVVFGVLRNLRRLQVAVQGAKLAGNELGSDVSDGVLLSAAYLLAADMNTSGWKEFHSQDLTEFIPESILASMYDLAETAPSGNDQRPLIARLGVAYSFPDWMVDSLANTCGIEETEQILASLNHQAPTTLRVNTLKCTRQECQDQLLKEGVSTTPTRHSPFGLHLDKRTNISALPSFKKGWFEIQDEGSQLVPLALGLDTPLKILDACAGAGGKTLEIAMCMHADGELVATDIHPGRLKELLRRTKRAGVKNIRVVDPSQFEREKDGMREYFDIVLVDAPCSGTGTIRRNPGLKWTNTPSGITAYSHSQHSILESMGPLVRRGGHLVYCTCSVLADENETVVHDFLSKHSGFVQGVFSESTEYLRQGDFFRGPFFVSLPHVHGTDGFFCAALKKSR